ncbi:hypothetical protein SCUP234_10391 [Seiridium cupressi]
MYSRDETVKAVLEFYQEIVRHPYLNDSALVVPPPKGWDGINVAGKNETVLDLLRHLPYIRLEKSIEQPLIHWETIPICYSGGTNRQEFYTIPPHCIYFAHSVDREGTSLILDTDKGTITEFSHTGENIVIPYEEYEALNEAEKWTAFRSTPTTEFFNTWTTMYEKLVWMLVPGPIGQPVTGNFYSRAENRTQEKRLAQQMYLEPWYPQGTTARDTGESAFDNAQGDEGARHRKHVADVYNTYLRHGWPGHFDKEKCRAELLLLEKDKWAEDKRLMDEANPDAELSD